MMRKPDFVQRVDEDIRPAYIESSDDANHSLSVLKSRYQCVRFNWSFRF